MRVGPWNVTFLGGGGGGGGGPGAPSPPLLHGGGHLFLGGSVRGGHSDLSIENIVRQFILIVY